MINSIIFFVQLILLVLGGYLLANLLIKEEHLLEKFSLGFLLNLGIFTFMWFILNLLNIPYNLPSAVFLVGLQFVIFLFLNLITKRINFKKDLSLKSINLKKISTGEKILVILIATLSLSSLINNLYWPVEAWDSLALYDFRAKVFLATGFMKQGVALGYFFQYPLFTSLFHTWVYVNKLGNPMFLYTFVYSSFLLCFYFSLRKHISRFRSLFWTFALATLPLIYEHSTIAYTNMPYTVFIVLSILYFYRYTKKRKMGLIIISSILLSISAWTRSTEPFWLGPVIIAVIYTIYAKKYFHLVIYLAILFLSKSLWTNYLSSMQLGNDYGTGSILSAIISFFKTANISELYKTTMFLYKNIFLSWGWIFIIFLIFSIRDVFRKINNTHNIYLLQVFMQLGMLIAGIYIFSLIFPGWADIPDSATRMAMFFPPLFIYYVGLKI